MQEQSKLWICKKLMRIQNPAFAHALGSLWLISDHDLTFPNVLVMVLGPISERWKLRKCSPCYSMSRIRIQWNPKLQDPDPLL